MIATLTLNPAIDKNFQFDRLVAEKKIRCSAVNAEAGGGGINISKAIKELGGNSVAVYPEGGMTGKLLTELLQRKEIATSPVGIAENTRENFNADEQSNNNQFRFITPGPAVSDIELENVTRKIEELEGITYLVCSGSLPGGVEPSYIQTLSALCQRKQIKFVIDTSGEPLKLALQHGAFMVKPNVTELKSLIGKDYLDETEIASAAKHVIGSSKVEVMIVSMGPAGALLVTVDKTTRLQAPTVKKVSTVGAGDSMVAGIVWMLDQGHQLEDAVRFGIACGTAATMRTGSQLFLRADAERLYKNMSPV